MMVLKKETRKSVRERQYLVFLINHGKKTGRMPTTIEAASHLKMTRMGADAIKHRLKVKGIVRAGDTPDECKIYPENYFTEAELKEITND